MKQMKLHFLNSSNNKVGSGSLRPTGAGSGWGQSESRSEVRDVPPSTQGLLVTDERKEARKELNSRFKGGEEEEPVFLVIQN